MGIRSEDAVKEDHYFCEQCRPELHVELLKYARSSLSSLRPPIVTPYRRLAKRPRDRHSSSTSHPPSVSANRNSRSHSPSHQKPQKRRNTMNSRDAAYDDAMMALIVENSAAEAAGVTSAQSPPSPINGSVNGQADGDEQLPSPATAKRKRKRASEDASVCLSPISYFVTHRIPTVARQSNAHDPRRRPLIDPLCQSPLMRTLQRRRPSPSQCPHLQFHLQRAARHVIDVVVVEAGPQPRRRMQRL